MQGLTTASIKAGGAIIDTNGFNITIGQPLLHDASLGLTPDGGLTKLGNGTLKLTGQQFIHRSDDGECRHTRAVGDGERWKEPCLRPGRRRPACRATLGFDYTSSSSPASTIASILAAGYAQPTRFSSSQIRATVLSAGQTIGWKDDGTAVQLIVTLPGDTNLDHHVDFNDLLALAKSYGQTSGTAWAKGDFDYNGSVDFNDLLLLAKNYNGVAAGSGDARLSAVFAADWWSRSSVPEPISLTALACLAMTMRRRRPSR